MKPSLIAAVLATVGGLAAENARACETPRPDARVQIRFLGDASLTEVVEHAARSSCIEYRFDRTLARRMLLGPVQLEVVGADLDATYAILFHTMNLAVEGRGPTRKLVATGPETERSKAVVRIEDEITKIDDHHFRITRRGFDAVLGNFAELSRSVRVVPDIRNGKSAGLRLFSIRPGSVLALLGFQNADVIRSMNDIELTSPDEALKAYTKIRVANAVRLGMERIGAPLVLEVTVLGPPVPLRPPPPLSPPPLPPEHHEASRTDLDAAFHNTRLRIVPEVRDGKAEGVRLFSLNRTGPVLDAAGFQNGDVIHAINGNAVVNPASFLEKYEAAVKASRIEFSLQRLGRPVTLVVNVK